MAAEPGVLDSRHEDRRGRLVLCWSAPCAMLGWLSARLWLLIKTIQCVLAAGRRLKQFVRCER